MIFIFLLVYVPENLQRCAGTGKIKRRFTESLLTCEKATRSFGKVTPYSTLRGDLDKASSCLKVVSTIGRPASYTHKKTHSHTHTTHTNRNDWFPSKSVNVAEGTLKEVVIKT